MDSFTDSYFPVIQICIRKFIICFSFPCIRKRTANKICFFKNYICHSIFNY